MWTVTELFCPRIESVAWFLRFKSTSGRATIQGGLPGAGLPIQQFLHRPNRDTGAQCLNQLRMMGVELSRLLNDSWILLLGVIGHFLDRGRAYLLCLAGANGHVCTRTEPRQIQPEI